VHELSICQSLVDQVEQIALSHGAQSVASVNLKVGPLSGVEPTLLQHAYPYASAGTLAAESTLVIELAPLNVRCEICGSETEAQPNWLVCGACGDCHTKLVSGDEMILMRVELVTLEVKNDV
jgi:hydrogenase nickel incorporation protein HypA/HybF